MSFSSFPSGAVGGIDPLVGSPDQPTIRPHVMPLQAITKPSPTVFVDMKYYVCTVANASFHRYDGTRIGFRFGFLETNVEATQHYLDWEIQQGNLYLRHASTEEVQEAKMRLDPVGTIREKYKEELELELRVKLEAEIREKMNASDPQQAVNRSNVDAEKLAGMDVRDRIQRTTEIRTGEGAKVIVNPATVVPNRMSGVVSSNDIKGATKG